MFTRHYFVYLIFVISLMGGLLESCTAYIPTADQIDTSPFTGIPCAAPCWQGLVIGESNESEVLSTLSSLTFINPETINVVRMSSMPWLDPYLSAPGVELSAQCIQPNRQCVYAGVVNGVLTEVDLSLNYDITVGEAIEYLGDPDHVGYRLLSSELIICEVELIWSDKQLVLASGVLRGLIDENDCGVVRDTGKVASSLLISEVRYISPEAIEFTLDNAEGQYFRYSGTIPEN